MESTYTDFTFREVEILISIHNLLPRNVQMYMKKLAFQIGEGVNNPQLWKIAKILIKEGIFEIGLNWGDRKNYAFVDDKKLVNLIQRQKVIQPLFKFFEDIHSIVI